MVYEEIGWDHLENIPVYLDTIGRMECLLGMCKVQAERGVLYV